MILRLKPTYNNLVSFKNSIVIEIMEDQILKMP